MTQNVCTYFQKDKIAMGVKLDIVWIYYLFFLRTAVVQIIMTPKI